MADILKTAAWSGYFENK